MAADLRPTGSYIRWWRTPKLLWNYVSHPVDGSTRVKRQAVKAALLYATREARDTLIPKYHGPPTICDDAWSESEVTVTKYVVC